MARLLLLPLALAAFWAAGAVPSGATARACAALAWSPPADGLAASNAAELRRRLDEARGGGTILLAGGDYGRFELSGYQPSGDVVIAAADPDSPPEFSHLGIDHSSRLTLAGIRVRIDVDSGKPLRVGDLDAGMTISGSRGVVIRNVHIIGKAEPAGTRHRVADSMRGTRRMIDFSGLGRGLGLRVDDSSGIRVEGSTFSDLTVGTNFNRVADVRFIGNTYSRISVDSSDWSGIDGLLFRGNLITDNDVPRGMKHADLMQFRQSTSRDVTIDNNVLISASPISHGIYFGSSRAGNFRFVNIVITNNLVLASQRLALAVEHADGLTIAGNRVLSNRAAGRSPAAILVEESSTNVRVTKNTANVISASVRGFTKNRPAPPDWVWTPNKQVAGGARPPDPARAPACSGS
ncbi:MAG: right-handed parallel beta-helix repeat-containing protein [Amaricoccus sp.]